MRAIPIPDHIVEHLADGLGGRRVVIGEPGDPTRTDVRPCEYILGRSTLYPGRHTFTALLEVDDDERAAIAAGAKVLLILDGGEVPWTVATYIPPPDPKDPT